jgi:hypothetical protein
LHHPGQYVSTSKSLEEQVGMENLQKLFFITTTKLDIAKNKPGLQEEVRMYCKIKHKCLRISLLECLDIENAVSLFPGHLCCSICKNIWTCTECIHDALPQITITTYC